MTSQLSPALLGHYPETLPKDFCLLIYRPLLAVRRVEKYIFRFCFHKSKVLLVRKKKLDIG